MRKQWIVLINVEYKFYECSKQIWIHSKHDVQRANFINVEIDFINAQKEIRLLWNLNMKKHIDLAFKFREHNFWRCFMRKQWTISKYGVLQLAKKKVAKATFKSSAKHLDIHKKKFHIPFRNTACQELTYPGVVKRKFFSIFKWSNLSAILINHLTIQ